MGHIKMPVRYCYVDWMLFDADDQWIASFDAGDVGPKIACILNSYPDLLAACEAQLHARELYRAWADNDDMETFEERLLPVLKAQEKAQELTLAAIAKAKGE